MGIVFFAIGIHAVIGSAGEARPDGKDNAPDAEPVVVIPANFRVNDLGGRQHVLGSGAGGQACRGVALIFLSTECPMCNSAIPKLNRIGDLYLKQGIEFYGVISDRTVTREAARKHRDEYQIRCPMRGSSAGTNRGDPHPGGLCF
jgi:hypothetical protein